jgi:uncharacterized protein (TIGR02597 family)
LTDNDATWTDNQFNGANGAHYIEITSGPGAGTTYDVTATTAPNTLTLAQSLASGVANGSTFKIRKHWTLASVFGPGNEAGLAGGTASTADQILIYTGAGFSTYYYKTVGPNGTGWRNFNDNATSEANHVIYPDDGLVIKRTQSADVNVVLSGAVKTGQSSYPVIVGNNFIANVSATSMTLADSGLYTDNETTGLKGGTASTADQVLIWNGTGYATYYYKTVGPNGTGWRNFNDNATPADTTTIPLASCVVIVRKAATGFNWVIPQHPVSLN